MRRSEIWKIENRSKFRLSVLWEYWRHVCLGAHFPQHLLSAHPSQNHGALIDLQPSPTHNGYIEFSRPADTPVNMESDRSPGDAGGGGVPQQRSSALVARSPL